MLRHNQSFSEIGVQLWCEEVCHMLGGALAVTGDVRTDLLDHARFVLNMSCQ